MSPVIAKTLDLCATILEDPELKACLAKVDTFTEDSAARNQFVQLSRRGDELHGKQHAGTEISPDEIRDFQKMQSTAMENEIIRDFVEAQDKLQKLHSIVSEYVAKTLELGRVPGEDDFADEEGGCGEGCGCH